MSDHYTSIQRKRAARLAAVQSIYQSLTMKEPLRAAKKYDAIRIQWNDEQAHRENEWGADAIPEPALLKKLLDGVEAHLAELDNVIESVLREGWTLARMPYITVAILRAAVFELRYHTDLEEGIIVDEYVTMAGDYIDESEVDYVHATLRKLGGQLRNSNT